jgi:iron complex transport system permease protein
VNRWSPRRLLVTIGLSAVGWAIIAGLCLLIGVTGGFGLPSKAALDYRLEMVLLASLVGAALAASGVVYQAILRNPLADPYLLGVSSGSALFAYLWQFASFSWIVNLFGDGTFALGQQVFAFVGAVVAMGLVFTLASQRGRLEPVTLLLVGVIVNAVNGAIFLLLNSIVHDQATQGGALSFLVGGLQTSLQSWQIWTATVVFALGWVFVFFLAGRLNVAGLSEVEAHALGVRIHRLRWEALIVASLITASAVAISGPIGFVGLVCPHLARLIVGNDQRRLLPVATAMGAGLLAIANALSRLLTRQDMVDTVLPVGVLTGLMGGPFFLFLLWRSRNRFASQA